MKKYPLVIVLSALLVCIAAFVLVKRWTKDNDGKEVKAEEKSSNNTIPHGLGSVIWPDLGKASDESHNPIGKLALDGNLPVNNESEAGRLLQVYKAQYIGTGLKGSELLDVIYAIGLQKNRENFEVIRHLIRLHMSDEEKISLLRILANFYSKDDSEKFNNEVLLDLREFAQSRSAGIGRAAALAYSRLGYFADSEAILKSARESGYIDMDQYSGELAYLLVISPKEAHNRILTDLTSSNSQFSAEILASLTQDPTVNERLSSSTIEAIRTYLIRNEPSFPTATDQFGLIGAIKYSDWLRSTAILSGAVSDKEFMQYVDKQLNRPTTDPRKIISILISPDGERLMNNLAGSRRLHTMLQAAQAYAREHPQNQTIQECIVQIDSKSKENGYTFP